MFCDCSKTMAKIYISHSSLRGERDARCGRPMPGPSLHSLLVRCVPLLFAIKIPGGESVLWANISYGGKFTKRAAGRFQCDMPLDKKKTTFTYHTVRGTRAVPAPYSPALQNAISLPGQTGQTFFFLRREPFTCQQHVVSNRATRWSRSRKRSNARTAARGTALT